MYKYHTKFIVTGVSNMNHLERVSGIEFYRPNILYSVEPNSAYDCLWLDHEQHMVDISKQYPEEHMTLEVFKAGNPTVKKHFIGGVYLK